MAHAPAGAWGCSVTLETRHAAFPPGVDNLSLSRVHQDELQMCDGQMALLAWKPRSVQGYLEAAMLTRRFTKTAPHLSLPCTMPCLPGPTHTNQEL